jgi:L-Ala-D/L-Glu epimerase
MKLTWLPYSLQLKKPFGIATSTRTSTPVVFVMLEDDSLYGIGEASLPPYLQETQESVINFLQSIDMSSMKGRDHSQILEQLHQKPGNNAAKAAFEIALLDLVSKRNNVPAFEFLGLKNSLPHNTYTIGIGPLEEIPEKLEDATQFERIKVKLGSDHDKEIINEIRKYTEKPLCIDANQGWTDKNTALEMIKWLSDQNTLLIEQPLAKADLAGHAWLSERSPLPIYADESLQGIEDLDKVRNCFSGINIKLMKCGGPWQAVQLISAAKRSGLHVLLGSMNESSCANIAAAHLSSEADLTDLDGPFLINNNPFTDPKMDNGRIILNSESGLGLEFSKGFANFPERFGRWQ